MGAWDLGPFDNDDALDLLDRVVGQVDPDLVASVLSSEMLAVAATAGYVEAPAMSRAVAAAALVAMFVDVDVRPGGRRDWTWLDPVRTTPPTALVETARQVLARAFRPGNNELYDLWKESGSVDAARAATARYVLALT